MTEKILKALRAGTDAYFCYGIGIAIIHFTIQLLKGLLNPDDFKRHL